MISTPVAANTVSENETIELIHWLYYLIVYYTVQITCLISVRMKQRGRARQGLAFASIRHCCPFLSYFPKVMVARLYELPAR